MAPLPANNTDRYFLDYETGGHNHTMVMRTETSIAAVAASDVFDQLLTALHDLLFQITIVGLRFQEEGTNVSLPRDWAGDATYGGSVGASYTSAQYLDFVGRGADGRRARVAVFGATFIQQGNDYRATPTEQPAIGDAIEVLNTNPDYFEAISGSAVSWYAYANTGVNAYWRNHIR
jgi:hypothetical protein